MSLGIDLTPQSKQCNFDCLYCELEPAATVDHMQEIAPADAILYELETALRQAQETIDVVTITANGEPTLYPELTTVVQGVNRLKGNAKSLILSNASTITDEAVQESLLPLDIVKLSLDCATPACFKKLDRPHAGITIENVIRGLSAFRKRYQGEMVLEILFVAGLNDSSEEIAALQQALESIQPDRVDLGTVDRPPAYAVKPLDAVALHQIAAQMGNLPVSVVHRYPGKPQQGFTRERLLSTLQRRPLSQMDIESMLDSKAQEMLQHLVDENHVTIRTIAGMEFYVLAEKL